ncbi:MAG: hypothetical protein IKD37_02970 [Clostridia bacterium]|nr:hypothetical protein [Clostridia bacterium]
MKKLIVLFLTLASLMSLIACSANDTNLAKPQEEESPEAYKVEIADNYPIQNALKSAYAAGEQVTIKLDTITEHYYKVYVNGAEQAMDTAASDLTYSYYTFTMPNEDVIIEIEDVAVDIPGATTFIVDIWDRTKAEQGDRTGTKEEPCDCADAIELFYEDETTEYYFSCIKSHYVTVMDNTGRTVDIVTALSEGLATIADLDYYGIEYFTAPKNDNAGPDDTIPDEALEGNMAS